MKSLEMKLPIRVKGNSIALSLVKNTIGVSIGRNAYYLIVRPIFFYGLFLACAALFSFSIKPILTSSEPNNPIQPEYLSVASISQDEFDGYMEGGDIQGFLLDYFEDDHGIKKELINTYTEEFLIKKQLLITKFLIDEKVNRVDQLPVKQLKVLHKTITDMFSSLILKRIGTEYHVLKFFMDTTDLDKVETALMEQAKYHVPTSITLAQSALETGYGTKIPHNNYFGIKAKGKGVNITTTEYFTAKELKRFKGKILSKEVVYKGGKKLYKCKVKDSFQPYETPWHSFRAHSEFLASQSRYAPLFTKGKNYEAWATKIGSSKYGGVGYATSPVYGELLTKIIERYHLYLLDF